MAECIIIHWKHIVLNSFTVKHCLQFFYLFGEFRSKVYTFIKIFIKIIQFPNIFRKICPCLMEY